MVKGSVVLVHGFRVTPEMMVPYANEFAKAGYIVVAPILTGHGGSE